MTPVEFFMMARVLIHHSAFQSDFNPGVCVELERRIETALRTTDEYMSAYDSEWLMSQIEKVNTLDQFGHLWT